MAFDLVYPSEYCGKTGSVNAFRSGVKGLFCFSEYPFRLLCKCIQSVHRGQVWANSEQLQYLIEGITQVPSLRMVNAMGIKLLIPTRGAGRGPRG